MSATGPVPPPTVRGVGPWLAGPRHAHSRLVSASVSLGVATTRVGVVGDDFDRPTRLVLVWKDPNRLLAMTRLRIGQWKSYKHPI